ncbi:MAG: preprotein translocase subunit SecG [Butyrivibrio sp.]
MDVVRIIISVLFIIDCIVLTAVVLMQEGKSAGLGSISGAAEMSFGKTKGRTMEGMLEKITKICAVVFFVAAIVLNLKVFK